jgi:hypothetical protein
LSTSKTIRCSVLRRWPGRGLAGLLGLHTEVQQHRGVAAVVEDHVGLRVGRPVEDLLGAPPVLLEGLALPGEDRDALRGCPRCPRADDDRGGRVVLGGEDVAEAQRTSAPSATRVSISTAVWMVMCSEPAMRAPARGLSAP